MWLEELDDAQRLANRLIVAFRTLLTERCVDLALGRTLPRLLRSAGLVGVQSDAYFPMSGPVSNELERATIEQILDRLIERNLATRDEIDEHLRNVAAGRLDLATSPMVSAWGRKAA